MVASDRSAVFAERDPKFKRMHSGSYKRDFSFRRSVEHRPQRNGKSVLVWHVDLVGRDFYAALSAVERLNSFVLIGGDARSSSVGSVHNSEEAASFSDAAARARVGLIDA